MSTQVIISAFIMLFVVINPMGAIPAFVSLTSHMNPKMRHRVALKSPFVAFILTLFAALVGDSFLTALGISMPAFRIAGGLMLFVIAFQMLFTNKMGINEDRKHPDSVAIFPLGIPLLAGPGCITAVILLVGNHPTFTDLLTIIGILCAVFFLITLLFIAADRLYKYMNASVNNLVQRLFGLILASLSVQFVIDGGHALLFAVPH